VTEPSSFVIVLTTFPADRDPLPLAARLVEEQLVACVNVLPAMTSVYRWEGKIEQATEHQLVMKTTQRQVEALKARLKTLHPYDVPELLVLTVADGDQSYLQWVQDNA
jgi:periplasmic divalent cation tolerance protein